MVYTFHFWSLFLLVLLLVGGSSLLWAYSQVKVFSGYYVHKMDSSCNAFRSLRIGKDNFFKSHLLVLWHPQFLPGCFSRIVYSPTVDAIVVVNKEHTHIWLCLRVTCSVYRVHTLGSVLTHSAMVLAEWSSSVNMVLLHILIDQQGLYSWIWIMHIIFCACLEWHHSAETLAYPLWKYGWKPLVYKPNSRYDSKVTIYAYCKQKQQI